MPVGREDVIGHRHVDSGVGDRDKVMLRAVFRLALRRTEGLIPSVLQLLGLGCPNSIRVT